MDDQIEKFFGFIVMFLFIIIGLSIAPQFVSSSTSTTEETETPPENGYIQKAVYWYSAGYMTEADVNFSADHFDFLDTDFQLDNATTTALKAVNPDLLIIGYRSLIGSHDDDEYRYPDWDEIDPNEDWFLHDENASRIQNDAWGWYLMNPASAGWRTHLVEFVNSAITNGTYDGVFLDDVYAQETIDDYVPEILAEDQATWETDIEAFLTYFKANIIAGKTVFINTDDWASSDYVNLVDGRMFEGFVHPSWVTSDLEGVASGRSLALDIAMLELASIDLASGKLVWLHSGALESGNATQDTKCLNFCYNAFLLVSNESCYWGYNDWSHADGESGYYPIMDTNVGVPMDVYSEIGTSDVYMREFSLGYAVVNLSGVPTTVTVAGASIDLDSYEGVFVEK